MGCQVSSCDLREYLDLALFNFSRSARYVRHMCCRQQDPRYVPLPQEIVNSVVGSTCGLVALPTAFQVMLFCS